MDGSSSQSRSHHTPLPAPPALYQVPPALAPGRQSHYRSLLQDHPLASSPSSSSEPLPPIPPIPTSPPPNYNQLYSSQGIYYTPPFVPGLDPSADPIQQQPRIAPGQPICVPEWQPDQLVRNCPICNSAFSLFFRRHHCRKCGRVVCAPCSSYRMNLPSEAVVRPPNEFPSLQGLDGIGVGSSQWGNLLGPSSGSSPGSGSSNRASSITTAEQSGLGFFDWGSGEVNSTGQEDVRVCSECSTGSTPEQRRAGGDNPSIHRTWNGSDLGSTQGRPTVSEIWTPSGVNTPEQVDGNGRRRRQTLQGGRSQPYSYGPSTPPTRLTPSSYQGPSGPAYTPPPPIHSAVPQPHNSLYSFPPQIQAKYAAYFAARERIFGLSGSSSSLQTPTRTPSHPPQHHVPQSPHGHPSRPSRPSRAAHYHHPSPQNLVPPPAPVKLKETDFCPICTLPLPPPNAETGDESSREAHIQDCIRIHEVSNTPRRPSNNASAATSPDRGALAGTPSGVSSVLEFLRQSAGRTSGRMLIYIATEEDTWDYSVESEDYNTNQTAQSSLITSGGTVDFTGEISTSTSAPPPPRAAKDKMRKKAECVICFEEFEIGGEIARLECLCRYHKGCIREWFDRKGNGDCPIHAVRE